MHLLNRLAFGIIALGAALSFAADPVPLGKTAPLTIEGDLASVMVDGIDRFLLKRIEDSARAREELWRPWLRDQPAFEKAMASNRQRLAQILGVRDARPAMVEMELVATIDQPALAGRSEKFEAFAVRWRAFGDVHGEGLLLSPVGKPPLADVIAIPDADQTPEMISGLAQGVPPAAQFARRLAEAGCRVIVPVLIDRHVEKRLAPGRKDGPELSSREFVYRAAFDLGRHIIGYEVQKVLAAIDWCKADAKDRKLGVFGYGEGGMLALYAGALDERIDATGISGHVGQTAAIWQQPIERNVMGVLEHFDDVRLMAMIHPRFVLVEFGDAPVVKVSGKNAAPGELKPVEWKRDPAANPVVQATAMRTILKDEFRISAVGGKESDAPFGSRKALAYFIDFLQVSPKMIAEPAPAPQELRKSFDPATRQKRQLDELIRHNETILARCAEVRQEYMKKLDTSSLEKFEASAKEYRAKFYSEVLGRFDIPFSPMNPRTRKTYDTPKFTGYDVVLDVWPDVIAYGVLLLPKDLKPGEKRAVVVCQHGLEGRPKDCIEGDSRAYHDFAARLCERGYIVFAPQNPYIFGDRFRTLVRKANPMGKGLWSIIIPQHQQILSFLKSLDCVDAKRIAFYGLSYGGKTAMRVPAVLTDYCLSICSGDFNEWVFKNASTTVPWSYVWTGEYEIFEWDLGSTFNYAEMAALIAPRPFMVERGHFDGVGVDEWVAFEFAKVRRLYAKMGIADRCAIEWFWGPHTINGKGTFEFLDRHLKGGK